MKKRNSELLGLAGMWSGLFIFMSSTDPTKLPAILLIAPILWMFLCIVYTIFVLQRVLYNSQNEAINKKRIGSAVLIASVPTVLLLLQSIGQLTAKDLALVLILVGIGFAYLKRFRLAQKIE